MNLGGTGGAKIYGDIINNKIVNCGFFEPWQTRIPAIRIGGTGSVNIYASVTGNLIIGKGMSEFLPAIQISGISTSKQYGIFRNNTIVNNEQGIVKGSNVNSLEISNCILWNNGESLHGVSRSEISYSNIGEEWFAGTNGNICSDPLFADPNHNDYHLLINSPCVDTGDPNYVSEPNETDLDGEPRIMGCRVDMGADEFTIVNTAPVACVVGGDQIVEADSNCEAGVVLDGSCSSDVDSTPGTNDDINDFDWYEVIDPCDPNTDIYLGSGEIIECNLPLGEHIILLEVTDTAGASDSNGIIVTVEDVTPPEFSLSVEPNVLWPVNHKMVGIVPTFTVSDNCDESPEVMLVSITMNEGDDSIGDGHTDDDIQIDEGNIYLRAERSGTGVGRIYTITYQAVDDSGNVSIDTAEVVVPHDRR